jgi:hypothetical protein
VEIKNLETDFEEPQRLGIKRFVEKNEEELGKNHSVQSYSELKAED